MVLDIIGTAEVVSAQALLILPALLLVEIAIILQVRINMDVHQVITGMAQGVLQAAMKVVVGQIQLPEPKPGVNLLQMAAALILIGIMEVVTVGQILILEVEALLRLMPARV